MIGQQLRARAPSVLHDSSDEVYLLDEKKVASWTGIIDGVDRLWDLERLADRIRLLFAPTPEAAAVNAEALKVLRRVYRARLAALKAKSSVRRGLCFHGLTSSLDWRADI
jgi:hypothetical protein